MSDHKAIAESCANLCFAGLALAAGTATMSAFIVPIAALGGYLLDIRGQCDKRMAQKSVDAALKALKDSPDLTPTDLKAAAAWLKSRKRDLRLDPAKLAKAAQTGDLPQALFDQFVDDCLAGDGGARRVVLMALTAAYNTCRGHENFHTIFTQEVLIGLAKGHGAMIEKLDHLSTQISDSEARILAAMQALRPDDFAKHRDLIIGMAGSYAKNPDGTPITDIDAALRNIESALVEYVRMQEANELPRNAADHLDAVLARVNALNQRGEIASAGDELARARAALRDDIAEKAAGMIRLLDSSIAQTRLQNQPEQAAALLVEKLQLDGGANFGTMRHLFLEWFERGDRGLNFDAAVALDLARANLSHAKRPDQRATALSNFGVALFVLGAREAGTERLQLALANHTKALKDTSRGRDPLFWGSVQLNRGNVLTALGEREAGTKKLEAAVTAYSEALKEITRARVPLEWAKAQCCLGSVLTEWGQREAGTERLQAAVAAFTKALMETSRARVPQDWATAQNNLGTALTEWGRRAAGTERLKEAVAAFTESLNERTREITPLHWATSLGNRAVAQSLLADRCDDLALARSALQDLETAEPLLRDGGHIHFADYCAENIPAARAVVQRLSGAITH